jgi:hypothetical protein
LSSQRAPEVGEPYFNLKLTSLQVSVGQMVELAVTCNTMPEPQVQWFHDGQPIDVNNAKYVLKHDKGMHRFGA